jgi:hypothetical protein
MNMRKNLIIAAGLLAAFATTAVAQDDTDEKIKEIEKRLQKVEKDAATDRVKFTGDLRVEAHNIQSTLPAHYDGMELQSLMVNTIFYFQQNFDGQNPMTGFPPDVDAINDEIAQNYGDYLYFLNTLTFDQIKEFMGSVPPEMQQQLMGMLMPETYQPAYDWDNDVLYTLRLRLEMAADVAEDVSFAGRLAMYKPWGDATGVQVFNGQSNSINIDGTTASVPNSDIVRVERAYFDWKNIGGAPLYLSIGRRPSTGGPPLHLRQDEARGGTPLGVVIDFQFDGITAGWHINDESTFRLCYGLGYESGFGNAEQLQQPADRIKDAHFLGFNWDIFNTEHTYLQATVARAFDVTDGFNGLVVLPDNPVTGNPVGAPIVMRFTPSTNLGDISLASLLALRSDGPFDYFGSFSYMESDPVNVTTPFGGLFCDPYETPESQDAWMAYVGVRYTLPNDETKFGVEYNHGSEYWFSFVNAADDIIGAKTNTRGDVWETYVTHRIRKRFIVKLDYMHYDYEYSGSGWHLGAPKELDQTPILGYPTYDTVDKVALSFMARF